MTSRAASIFLDVLDPTAGEGTSAVFAIAGMDDSRLQELLRLAREAGDARERFGAHTREVVLGDPGTVRFYDYPSGQPHDELLDFVDQFDAFTDAWSDFGGGSEPSKTVVAADVPDGLASQPVRLSDQQLHVTPHGAYWTGEYGRSGYRVRSAVLTRAQMLGARCYLADRGALRQRFGELMAESPQAALQLIEEGVAFDAGEMGERLRAELVHADLSPLLQSDDSEVRQRGMLALGKFRRAPRRDDPGRAISSTPVR